jgi:hypothetical protein
MLFFAVIAAPLEYVWPELFDEAVDRHHRSYLSAVLERSSIHQRWIPKYVIHNYYLFLFLYNSNCVK